jgi:hypothetical protein
MKSSYPTYNEHLGFINYLFELVLKRSRVVINKVVSEAQEADEEQKKKAMRPMKRVANFASFVFIHTCEPLVFSRKESKLIFWLVRHA